MRIESFFIHLIVWAILLTLWFCAKGFCCCFDTDMKDVCDLATVGGISSFAEISFALNTSIAIKWVRNQFMTYFDGFVERRGATSQAEMARQLNMKQPQWARYESGASSPSVELLATICRVHACSADWLLGIDRASSSVDERERVGAESRGSGAVMPASGCRDSRQSRSPQVPGELPQCARCPHRKLADKMRKMIGEG